ncbi:formate dehydrogenase accessory sulfurtransferase FdhD [Candidatus Magnetominusculus xianensis]|uniref:Sulfur carrier protein FdhD n=1 Tax=Candidatus Magnetominusculus xianensis TaxID=1748249 RepID=A0ABR5SKU2_9BACT|nr:formate dehydrogenase accessory sulfurtransferase FdhD [Candidatus Magnetominusculus xianensis]KWT92921.1 formate dehydrogenase accessory protein FdhD [Candidatus Magnetominusculus xianensis]MBF0402925.1 formate dehydrogenase accessory sulfurtransferase FdhD [Nitrospirota bacterium]
MIIERTIQRVVGSNKTSAPDPIAIEKKLRLRVNSNEILSLYCSPVMIKELVVGFIMGEGIIKGSWCTEKMSINMGDDIVVDIDATGEVSLAGKAITSGCIGGITIPKEIIANSVTSTVNISPESLLRLFGDFQRQSLSYQNTGCIHSAAISDASTIIAFAEDIGRHNAVDKVIGASILEDFDLSNSVMLLSGRLSSEIASKCARWSIPIVASRTAPTSLSVEIAEKAGVTMVGFLRGTRFNVYTHPQRIS